MYNANIPSKAELPSTAQLIRSTVIAIVTAGALLVTVVLPAEYAIDPTGIGKALGFTEQGEIKVQLAAEADADRAADRSAAIEAAAAGATLPEPADAAAAPEAEASADAAEAPGVPGAAASREDETRITLKPGEGAEVKLVMKKGQKTDFVWTVAGGVVNSDLHGDGGGNSISYEKKRGLAKDQGTVTAAFDGNHGWFWRNRGDADVVVILKVRGAHSELKRVA
ncbi:transmembrane anchor protein [Sphingopyxis sp. SCN 67-31]|uniref:transmembrane anchor protein n=1 Tax=Sphingopyxis sp. SCN 67-31 TaxID=1660142 RepID=UPI00086DE6C9|nr:transmembrane anchor protein [Sphingopyxis sp. SCN 67-31]ODU35146.1 MAG: transmembrane anchor protein [Sphingopyxis sp. SCN 67-31]